MLIELDWKFEHKVFNLLISLIYSKIRSLNSNELYIYSEKTLGWSIAVNELTLGAWIINESHYSYDAESSDL